MLTIQKCIPGFLVLAALLLPYGVVAQAFQHETRYFSNAQGFSDREIVQVHKDDRGFLWAATIKGVDRYDGYNTLHFGNFENEQFQLSGTRPRQCIKVAPNRLLVCYGGTESFTFDLINTHTLSVLSSRLEKPHADSEVQDIQSRGDGSFLVLVRDSTGHILFQANQDLSFTKILEWSNPTGIKKETQASQLALCPKGLYVLDASINKVLHKSGWESRWLDLSINTQKQKNPIFIGRKDGSLLYQDGSSGIIRFPAVTNTLRSPEGNWTHAWQDDQGNLLLAEIADHYTHALELITTKGLHYKLSKFLETEAKITSIGGSDFTQQILFGSFNGLYLYSANKLDIQHALAQTLDFGEWGNIIRGITSDEHGQVYLANEVDNWYRLNPQTWEVEEQYQIKDNSGKPIAGFRGSTRLFAHNGVLYGTSIDLKVTGRFHALDLNSLDCTTWEMPELNEYILDFIPISEGAFLLFCLNRKTRTSLIRKLDINTGRFTLFAPTLVLGKAMPNIVSKGPEGNIWIGTTEGIYVVNPKTEKFRKLLFNQQNREALINSVFAFYFPEKTEHAIAGTEFGLVVFDKKNGQVLKHFTQNNHGLPNDKIAGILPISNNELLLSTWYGVSAFNLDTERSLNLYEKNGLSSNEFNRLSFHKDDAGNFYLGSINGINIIPAGAFSKLLDVAPPVVSRFFNYNSDTEKERSTYFLDGLSDSTIIVSPNNLYFGFDFMHEDIQNQNINYFQTWLEGHEKTWLPPSTQHSIRYDGLEPGNYTLHIRYCNARAPELHIPILVQGHFYEKRWVQLLGMLALGLGSMAWWNYRKTQKNKIELERRDRESKLSNLELQIVRTQLNPHFVFNALASIQYFIQLNQSVEAERYLSRFARLMRLFLESSRSPWVSVREEVQILELYCQLEQMRFDNKFDFKIEIDPAIDLDDTQVPSSLLQPIVENAINHGLVKKQGKGLLEIKLDCVPEQAQLVWSITDDGIGREKAMELKANKKPGHISRAMELIKKRIHLLNDSEEYQIQIKFVDRYHPDQTPNGTQVLISIPWDDED